MLLSSWLNSLKSSSRRRKSARRSRRCRRAIQPPIAAEVLEDRTLLSALTVNSLADNTTPGDGNVTLREAIVAANSDGMTDLGQTASGADEIVFDAALTGNAIQLNGTQLPTITDDLTITGLGAGQLAIDAQGNSRIFVIDASATVEISGLTLTGGNTPGAGGGIFNFGTLTVRESTLSNNSAERPGGAVRNAGTMTVADSILSGNSCLANGGAITNNGTMRVIDSTISGNTAHIGGGIRNGGGTLIVSGSILSGNTAGGGAGGIHNGGGGELTVIDSTISDNTTPGSGGGIFNIFGTTTVTDSTISNNMAGDWGGGIHTNQGPLAVTGSTISGNTAGKLGGGVNTWRTTTTVINSTISGNSANGGGGVNNDAEGTLSVTNGTIVLNRADADGNGFGNGGGIQTLTGSTTLNNTIVAGNLRGAEGADVANDLFGNVEAGSAHNLIGDVGSSGGLLDGIDGNIVGKLLADVLDLELKDNGGPTLTHALVTDSAAIDVGSDALAVDAVGDPLTTDQRGLTRVVGGSVDIGAYELQNALPEVDDFTKQGAEDNDLAFSAAYFTAYFIDADGDALVAVRIETLPTNGTLELSGVAVSAGQEIDAADLDDLVFVPDTNFNGTVTFQYSASDGIAGFAVTPATVTLEILSAAQQSEEIANEIEELFTEGVLTDGEAEALTLALKDNNGDVGKVQGFLNQIEAFIEGGVLTQEEADALLEGGNALQNSLTTT